MSGAFERASSNSGGGASGDGMSSSSANLKKDGRRMSSTGPGEAYSSQPRDTKENRRPLSAVLSEDHISAQQQAPRQSLLSKLTHHQPSKSEGKDCGWPQDQQHGNECDTKATSSSSSGTDQQLNNRSTTTTTTKATTATAATTTTEKPNHKSKAQQQQQLDSRRAANIEVVNSNEDDQNDDEEEDDDNQVVPQWPSRSDAPLAFKSGPIQHQVYSLKDYSQVSNPSAASSSGTPPTATTTTTSIFGGSGSASSKLLKSMSQDRKIKSNTKRLSECIYTGAPMSSLLAGHNQSTTGGAASKQRTPSVSGQLASNSFSMGPASSVNSLLAPSVAVAAAAAPATSSSARHSPFPGESRMDRMKKLFASPLSLKSNKMASADSAAHRGATANPRLSLQSGSSMFNKPHHLMHAVYRTRAGIAAAAPSPQAGAHHNRRSPLRQKQGKSFRVYGCPLQMANNIYPITCFGRPDIYKQQSVPYILARLCNYIEENSSALTHEGIFRVSGNARLMEKLRTLFDRLGDAPLELESVDVATSASMLKMYLRELPEPLIPTRMNYYFIALAKKYANHLAKDSGGAPAAAGGYRFEISSTSVSEILSENQTSIERHRAAFLRDLTKLVRKLPIENYNLLKYLACFLFRISLKQQYNKMCAEALGIVFGPNIFRIRSESYKGLREQELSNQIMASIIGNYKSIFDCELTDPLGNLVECTEDLESEKVSLGKPTKIKPQQASAQQPKEQQPSEAAPAEHKVAGSSKTSLPANAAATTAAAGASSTLPVQSSSGSELGNSRIHHHHRPLDHTCCPTHCRGYKYKSCRRHRKHSCGSGGGVTKRKQRPPGRVQGAGVADALGDRVVDCDDEAGASEEEDEDEDEDEDIEEDDDDDGDCNEEESYTPSSASESCYSISGSDTIESSYDGEDDDEEEDDDDDAEDVDDENVDMASGSSLSQCGGSDTSYTPSSSPTESDGEGNSMDENERSSSLVSNPSLLEDLVPGASHPCNVCKRRESAQAELLMSRNNTCDTATIAKTTNPTIAPPTRGGNKNPPNVGSSQQQQQQVVSSDIPPSERRQSDGYHPHRGSSRRKRQEGSSKKHHGNYQLSVEESSSRRAASDTAEDDRVTKTKHYNEARSSGGGGGAVGSGKSRAPKYDFLRRRSSSASSLNRIKHKHERMVAAHRKHDNHHGKSSRASRRATGESSTSKNRSSRRSRAKNHNAATKLGDPHPAKSVRKFGERSGQFLDDCADHPDIYQVTEGLSALNLPDHLDKESAVELTGMEMYAPEYLEDHEGERYYLLRSFNSDETLLRSVNYCLESPQDRCVRSRRRYSGYEIDDHKPEFPIARRPFDQILEAMDPTEEAGHSAAYLAAETLLSPQPAPSQAPSSGGAQQAVAAAAAAAAAELAFNSSIISLLDHQQMSNFRRSQMSINEASLHTENPIQVQMRSMKELIRSLKRQLRHGSAGVGYSKTMEEILVKMSSQDSADLLDYSNDCSTCYIDYLSARDLARQIEEDLELFESGGGLPSTSTGLSNLLNVKITLFKQRYNDLENIHDHCFNSHNANHSQLNQAAAAAAATPMRSTQADDLEGDIRSLDQQDFALMGKSILDSTTSVSSANHQRESPPDKTTTTKQTSSGAVKVADCKYGSLCPIEFVFNIEKQLAMKRALGLRLVKLHEMSVEQLQSEKLELQKNLLRYEHWFGRPVTRLEFSFVGHLYERYRAVKIIKTRKLRQLELA